MGSEMRGTQAMTDTSSRIVVEKVNVLLIGPTGSGCYLFTVVTSYMLIMYSCSSVSRVIQAKRSSFRRSLRSSTFRSQALTARV